MKFIAKHARSNAKICDVAVANKIDRSRFNALRIQGWIHGLGRVEEAQS